MSDTIEDAKTEPRPTWTKLKDGWKVRIPKEWWDNWSEAGETDEFPVFKANGEVSHVNIVKVSKPFVLDGVEYVIGTPRKETHRRGSAPSRTSTTARKHSGIRCEECGSTKGVHLTRVLTASVACYALFAMMVPRASADWVCGDMVCCCSSRFLFCSVFCPSKLYTGIVHIKIWKPRSKK